MIVYAKLLRLKGNFSGAVESLESCLKVRLPGVVDDDANMPKMTAHLAELSCEEGHEQAAVALEDVCRALGYWAMRGPQSKGYRRLQLAMVDVHLRMGDYKKAYDCVRALFLRALVEHIQCQMRNDRQDKQWVSCLERWRSVLDTVKAASCFEGPGYLDQFVRCWMAHAACSNG